MEITCGTACTVTVQLEPAPATEEKIADLLELFGYMLMVVILVWGARQLYDVFNRGPHDG